MSISENSLSPFSILAKIHGRVKKKHPRVPYTIVESLFGQRQRPSRLEAWRWNSIQSFVFHWPPNPKERNFEFHKISLLVKLPSPTLVAADRTYISQNPSLTESPHRTTDGANMARFPVSLPRNFIALFVCTGIFGISCRGFRGAFCLFCTISS